MANSGSFQPDLDWSQVRETIKLLTVSVAQVEGGMKVSDESVTLLASSFTSMVEDMQTVAHLLNNLQPGPERDKALALTQSLENRINSSIMAFQFFDRLQQCLGHVATGLRGLSDLIDTPQRLYNPAEWHRFQQEIRSRYTMESEKKMFDAILGGKDLDEALALVNNSIQEDGEEDIELF